VICYPFEALVSILAAQPAGSEEMSVGATATKIGGPAHLDTSGREVSAWRMLQPLQPLLLVVVFALSIAWIARNNVMLAQTAAPSSTTEPSATRQYIIFQAPINDTTSSRLISIVAGSVQKGISDIHIIVSSNGGSVSDALVIYNFLRAVPAKVTTYNLSTVQSAGELIYLAGEKRISAANGIFMFHNIRQDFGKPPSLSLEDADDQKTFLSMNTDRVDSIYRERTSLTAAQIETFKRHSVYLDATAARDTGIVHEIAALAIPPRAAITAVNPAVTSGSP
jgi:ATP-dependent protease ClpP protease subunit